MSKKKKKKLKNRPKQKSARSRASSERRPRKKAPSTSEAETDHADEGDEHDGQEESVIRTGILTGMRGWIAGAGEEGRGLSKRRSLGEWALWFAGLTAAYYLVKHLTA